MHFWFWKHNKQELPVIISDEDYQKIPGKHKKHFEKAESELGATYRHRDDGDDFGLSLAVGLVTHNAALGYIAGGSLSGGLLGQDIADLDGGSGGGGGASGSWGDNDNTAPAPDSGPAFDPGQPSVPDSSSSIDSTSVDSGGGSFDF